MDVKEIKDMGASVFTRLKKQESIIRLGKLIFILTF